MSPLITYAPNNTNYFATGLIFSFQIIKSMTSQRASKCFHRVDRVMLQKNSSNETVCVSFGDQISFVSIVDIFTLVSWAENVHVASNCTYASTPAFSHFECFTDSSSSSVTLSHWPSFNLLYYTNSISKTLVLPVLSLIVAFLLCLLQ